jgi:hypothetical protein
MGIIDLLTNIKKKISMVRLTKEQYVSFLSQEFYFANSTPINLRLAANNCPFPIISDFLTHHAKDEDGHAVWALQDIMDLGMCTPLPVKKETDKLISYARSVCRGCESYKILGLSVLVENLAPSVDLSKLLPENIGSAVRFIERHSKVDVKHAQEINELIAESDPPIRKGIEGSAMEFIILYADFLHAATDTPYVGTNL